ncbi:MAG TPA: SDR family oxidoreductase [Longimicrobiales bacterium]|nr:SDR family oxidoreductase [Longimicrobiales bacterium]
MRVLVTGGAGFIGSHLVEHLVTRGDTEVVVLDDLSTGRIENIRPFLDRIEWIEGSITDPETCARAVSGADFVLHQAALPSVPRSVREPRASHEVNATGTLNLLMAAREAGVRRFVYAASSSAYGNTPVLPKHEEMPSLPLSPYAAAKLTGESYCRAWYRSYGLETVALRYFNIFGPRQDPASEYAAVIPKFITAALDGVPPTIFGDGEQSRDFTYVTNAVQANIAACFAPAEQVAGEVFNVGCGDRITINQLWREIAALVGTDIQPNYAPPRTGDVRDSLASLERSRTRLGYNPETDLRTGLARTVEHFAALAGR